ncbi:hypothetical protein OIU78_029543 [Salix suchowensis]|nr:hypothetical protein OIU78_029543 [Salix suchowensis]
MWIGLGPCFNVSDAKTVSFPSSRGCIFKGGADVAPPSGKLFRICRWWGGVFDDGDWGLRGWTDPGMILGSFQMQNFYVEYDLRNERLGFKQEKCK